MQTPETGIEYPTITLAGTLYTVKLTRAALYRLDKAGIEISPRFNPKGVTFTLSNLVDIFCIVCQFPGTPEEAAELLYDQRNDFATKFLSALGKLLPQQSPKPEPLAASSPASLQ